MDHMAKRTKFTITENISLPLPSAEDLRGRQSVRATFKLSTRAIDALSIVAVHLGIKQKSLFDQLIEDAGSLSHIAREIESDDFSTLKRVQKTFVISRKTLRSLEDTVHFMYNFQKYYTQSSDPYFAVRETLLGTGRALLITSLVLSTGFFILMLASLNHLIRFGFFTGIAILIALLADFLLVPAMMVLIRRNKKAQNRVESVLNCETRS